MVKRVLAKDESGVRFSLPALYGSMQFSIPQEVSRITETLEKAGFLAYLVGGCVRHLLMEQTPHDWDITTNAKPEEITALFGKTFYENQFGTVTVVNEETTDPTLRNVEITPFRKEGKYSDKRHPDFVVFGESLDEDLQRRDFTINALAYNYPKGQLIDLYSGQKDIKDRVIRAVGSPNERFQEDPLRMLRGIRLASQLGFMINTETAESMKTNAHLISTVSCERIREEFLKIILSNQPMVGLILAQKLNILKEIIPELEEGLLMKQNGDHKYDVFEHIMRTLQHGADKNYDLEVRLGALFHDIGKPRTRKWDETKQDWTFYGHDVVGSKMTEVILDRLRFSKKMKQTIVILVRNHMFFSDTEKITLSAVRRLINRVGTEHIWQLMEVRNCDRIGMGRPKESPYRLRKYHSMIEQALRSPTSVTMLAIKGEDVLRETKLSPGPQIGYILHILLEEVLEKPELNTTDYLIDRTKELAKLNLAELAKAGELSKLKKVEVETQELKKILSKYHVE